MKRKFIGATLALCFAISTAGQAQTEPAATATANLAELLAVKIRVAEHLAFYPSLRDAVRRQNAEGLSSATIQERDEQWQQSGNITPFKRALQFNEAGRTLARFIRSNDDFVEAILMDRQGAAVAVYPLTTDYYQGDELHWSQAFADGAGRIHLDQLALDQSTGTNAATISVPIYDNSTQMDERNQVIGVLTMRVNESYLANRRQGEAAAP